MSTLIVMNSMKYFVKIRLYEIMLLIYAQLYLTSFTLAVDFLIVTSNFSCDTY